MDVDFLNSSPEDQMELMAMMMEMEMEKLSELAHPAPSLDLSGGPPLPPLYNATTASHSQPPLGALLPSSLPFATQDNMMTHPMASLLPNADLSFGGDGSGAYVSAGHRRASMAAMREMIFRIAAMQPVHIDPESVKPPKRRNVRISKDPQSVAARHRRERISERIRILQRLVPGGTKMDTASMLDEAIHYVKFLKSQVQSLERAAAAGRFSHPAAGNAGYTCQMGFMNPTQTLS